MALVTSFFSVFSQTLHITIMFTVLETVLSNSKATLEATKAKGAILYVLLVLDGNEKQCWLEETYENH